MVKTLVFCILGVCHHTRPYRATLPLPAFTMKPIPALLFVIRQICQHKPTRLQIIRKLRGKFPRSCSFYCLETIFLSWYHKWIDICTHCFNVKTLWPCDQHKPWKLSRKSWVLLQIAKYLRSGRIDLVYISFGSGLHIVTVCNDVPKSVHFSYIVLGKFGFYHFERWCWRLAQAHVCI